MTLHLKCAARKSSFQGIFSPDTSPYSLICAHATPKREGATWEGKAKIAVYSRRYFVTCGAEGELKCSKAS